MSSDLTGIEFPSQASLQCGIMYEVMGFAS